MEVDYDFNRYVCICFDGTFPLKYTLVPVFVGHFIPHAITIFCYARLLKVEIIDQGLLLLRDYTGCKHAFSSFLVRDSLH